MAGLARSTKHQAPALSLGLALLWSLFPLSHSLLVSLSEKLSVILKTHPIRQRAPKKQLLVSLMGGSSVKSGDEHAVFLSNP